MAAQHDSAIKFLLAKRRRIAKQRASQLQRPTTDPLSVQGSKVHKAKANRKRGHKI